PLASSKSQEDGPAIAHHGQERTRRPPRRLGSQHLGHAHREVALDHVPEQGEDGGHGSQGTQHVGGADVSAALAADVETPRGARPWIAMAIQAWIMSTWTREMRAAATRSLSATGSRRVPRRVTWLRRRATRPSSQSVREAAKKMRAAIKTCTRDDEIRKTMTK